MNFWNMLKLRRHAAVTSTGHNVTIRFGWYAVALLLAFCFCTGTVLAVTNYIERGKMTEAYVPSPKHFPIHQGGPMPERTIGAVLRWAMRY